MCGRHAAYNEIETALVVINSLLVSLILSQSEDTDGGVFIEFKPQIERFVWPSSFMSKAFSNGCRKSTKRLLVACIDTFGRGFDLDIMKLCPTIRSIEVLEYSRR